MAGVPKKIILNADRVLKRLESSKHEISVDSIKMKKDDMQLSFLNWMIQF